MKLVCHPCLPGKHSSQAEYEVKSASQEKTSAEKPASLTGTK